MLSFLFILLLSTYVSHAYYCKLYTHSSTCTGVNIVCNMETCCDWSLFYGTPVSSNMSCTSTGIAETAYIGSTCKGTVIYNSEISFTGCSPNEDTGTSLECTCPSTRTPTSVDGFPMWAIILVICVGMYFEHIHHIILDRCIDSIGVYWWMHLLLYEK